MEDDLEAATSINCEIGMRHMNEKKIQQDGMVPNKTDYLKDLEKALEKIRYVDDFNRVAKRLRAVSASDTRIIVELTVEKEHVNSKQTLHGGQTAALVDMVTARAVGMTVRDKAMVSVELAVSYMLPVRIGETIEIEAKVLKIGRNISFTEAEFRRKSDGRMVAKGKHTLAFIPKPPAVNGEPFEQF